MDKNEVLIGIAKSLAPPTFLSLSLGEWGTVCAIVFAVVNTVAMAPAAYRVVRSWINKE